MLQAFRPGGSPPRAQGIMGARRMPWHRKSTKGAASRDRPGGGANGPRSRDSRMGEPSRRHGRLPDWRPSFRGTTGGTETSKYPEEEKSTEIARVAASESARAQTCDGAKAGAVASQVLRDETRPAPPPLFFIRQLGVLVVHLWCRGLGVVYKRQPMSRTGNMR